MSALTVAGTVAEPKPNAAAQAVDYRALLLEAVRLLLPVHLHLGEALAKLEAKAGDLRDRGVVRRRRETQARQQESARAERRVKNLRRIVRRALSEHSRIRLEQQR